MLNIEMPLRVGSRQTAMSSTKHVWGPMIATGCRGFLFAGHFLEVATRFRTQLRRAWHLLSYCEENIGTAMATDILEALRIVSAESGCACFSYALNSRRFAILPLSSPLPTW
mgnify:CR=1 FL=1